MIQGTHLYGYVPNQSVLENLKEQVQTMRLLRPCNCTDDFYGSFYTSPRHGDLQDGQRKVDGTVILDENLNMDLRDGRIVYVEVLFQPEIRAKVYAVFGRDPG